MIHAGTRISSSSVPSLADRLRPAMRGSTPPDPSTPASPAVSDQAPAPGISRDLPGGVM